MRRADLLLAALAVLGPALMLGKCALRPQGDAFAKPILRTAASVMLITVDGIAAKALHLDSSDAPVRPAVDELARLGITCHFCFAATDSEPAAAASIATGQLPSTHGVLTFEDSLAPGTMTLGRAMALRGYRTAAFSNLPLFSQCGLGESLETTGEDFGADAAALGARAGKWLEGVDNVGGELFFLWLHFHPAGADSDPAAAFDHLVAAAVAAAQRARVLEGTFVCAAGAFDERGGPLQVPMVWRIPKRTAVGSERTGPCSTLDIAPTLLDLLSMRGGLASPGRSLIVGEKGNNPLFNGFYFPDKALFERFLPGDRAPILCLRGPGWEIDQGPKPADLALFDRSKKDPRLQVNLLPTENAKTGYVRDEMLKLLHERKARTPKPVAPVRKPLPAETAAGLKQLGY